VVPNDVSQRKGSVFGFNLGDLVLDNSSLLLFRLLKILLLEQMWVELELIVNRVRGIGDASVLQWHKVQHVVSRLGDGFQMRRPFG
jgi:hypothetical protein